MNLSDRIAVIFKGSIQKVLGREEANRRKLGALMAGITDEPNETIAEAGGK
jgi:simple sugar transport system ATP-binding protein